MPDIVQITVVHPLQEIRIVEVQGVINLQGGSGGATPPGMTVSFPIGALTIGGDVYEFPLNRALPVTVSDGVATFTYGGNAYAIPVTNDGPGAPAGTFDTDGVLIFFTAHGLNWQFPATLLS